MHSLFYSFTKSKALQKGKMLKHRSAEISCWNCVCIVRLCSLYFVMFFICLFVCFSVCISKNLLHFNVTVYLKLISVSSEILVDWIVK